MLKVWVASTNPGFGPPLPGYSYWATLIGPRLLPAARVNRRARSKLKLDWVTSHTFRKSLATLIDDQGSPPVSAPTS